MGFARSPTGNILNWQEPYWQAGDGPTCEWLQTMASPYFF